MLKKLFLKLSQDLAAVRAQVSRQQLTVTVASAAIMLTVLIVIWNLFILPGHLPEPSSKEIISKTEKAEPIPGTDTDTPTFEAKLQVHKQEVRAASVDNSLSDNPDLSLISKPIDSTLVKSFGFTFSPTFKDYRFHGGIDLAGEKGTAVKCVLKGVVESISASETEGYKVTVAHGGTWKSTYSHMDTVKVKKSMAVAAGSTLGLLGTPGSFEAAEGCHLHLEMLHKGEQINPLEYLDYQE